MHYLVNRPTLVTTDDSTSIDIVLEIPASSSIRAEQVTLQTVTLRVGVSESEDQARVSLASGTGGTLVSCQDTGNTSPVSLSVPLFGVSSPEYAWIISRVTYTVQGVDDEVIDQDIRMVVQNVNGTLDPTFVSGYEGKVVKGGQDNWYFIWNEGGDVSVGSWVDGLTVYDRIWADATTVGYPVPIDDALLACYSLTGTTFVAERSGATVQDQYAVVQSPLTAADPVVGPGQAPIAVGDVPAFVVVNGQRHWVVDPLAAGYANLKAPAAIANATLMELTRGADISFGA